ncbi:MAG: phage recombination protein Bet [Syntrophorhabdaceae bacterium]|nr:phage recombination protein Bet [Syntrophorhabdaceae bacterium]
MSDEKDTSIVKVEPSAIAQPKQRAEIELNPKTVRAYINKDASDQEIALFLNQCVMFNLNPFKREIYLIKYGNHPATFVVGYDAYLKRAERTEKYAGMKSGTIDDPKTGKPLKAWVKVYRKDWAEPLEHEVYLDEYIQTKPEMINGRPTGKNIATKFWAEKPRTMLKKVAISQAFRMAFPDEFSGMPYSAEEMPIDHTRLQETEVVAELAESTPATIPDKDSFFSEPEVDLTDPKVNVFEAASQKPSQGSFFTDEEIQVEESAVKQAISTSASKMTKEAPIVDDAERDAIINAIKGSLKAERIDNTEFKAWLDIYQMTIRPARHFVGKHFNNLSFHMGSGPDLKFLYSKIGEAIKKFRHYKKSLEVA